MSWFKGRGEVRRMERENIRLHQENERLRGRVSELEAGNAQLLAKLAAARKHSGNSSKPPSSDVVKPPSQRRRGSKRRAGGQPGHPRRQRPLLPPEQVDHFISYQLERCPVHDTPLTPSPARKELFQQAELVAEPVELTQYELRASWCARCGQWHWPQLPPEVKAGGLLGARLTALAGYGKSKLHLSYTGLSDLFDEVFGLTVCRGYLAKVLQKTSAALAAPVEELAERLPRETHLNVDETGHKERGRRFRTWCFRAAGFVLFRIDPSRSSSVLFEQLGREFAGVLGCDFFGAYRKYMGESSARVQFCLAHLIRELKFLAEHPHTLVQAYGRRVLGAVRRLFKVIHRREELRPEQFERALDKARKAVVRAATRTEYLSPIASVRRSLPEYRLVENMADRFRRYGEQYFTFITTPGVERTNNPAEQAIRFVVIDRRVTQGTRGKKGQRLCERLWTLVGTCALQKRSVFEYLVAVLKASFSGNQAPSLVPDDTS